MNRREALSCVAGALPAMSVGMSTIEADPLPLLIVVSYEGDYDATAFSGLSALEKRIGVPIVVKPKGVSIEAVVDPR